MLRNSILHNRYIALDDYDLRAEKVAVPIHDGMHNTLPKSINNLIIFDSESVKI